MGVKGLGCFYRSGVAPHIVFVQRRIWSPAIALSMGISWNNAKTLRDLVQVGDVSENAERGAVGEVNVFSLLLALEKALFVPCFAHSHLRGVRGLDIHLACHLLRLYI